MVVQMRYWKSYFIASFLVLILIGQSHTVMGQATPIANRIVINEVDTNPAGDDSKQIIQWVELYNPTNSPVNIGGWSIGATTGLRDHYTIPNGIMIPSQQFLVYTYGPLWFPHVGAVVQLKDSNGTVVDQTPPLSDQTDDTNSWQRAYDGYDTGSQSDWVFRPGNPGSSNGKLVSTTASSQITVSLATDKTSYNFGDTVSISGQVSKLAYSIDGYPQQVKLLVSGSKGFQKTFTLYPGNNLEFATSMKLDEILGFQDGNYTISASYGDAQTSTVFSLGAATFVPPPQAAPAALSIFTDKPTYTISQPITLSGNVSKVIPLTAVTYKVYDPHNSLVSQGTIFPDSQGKFSSFNPYQQHLTNSGITINSVNPIYGTYDIIAAYGGATATTSFTLVPESVQNSAISLSTDKQVYGLGDTVTITGRSNKAWVPSINLELVQSYSLGVVPQTLDIKTQVSVAGDSTFSYQYTIPGKPDRLGTYRVIASAPFATTESDFVVVENPGTYQAPPSSPLSITTDQSSYGIGDAILISGKVTKSITTPTITGVSVKILVINSNGSAIISSPNVGPNLSGAGQGVQATPLTFYAYPDSTGNFQIKETLARSVFEKGNYTLKAIYGTLSATTSFNVYDPLDTGSQGSIIASTNKKVYGIGETVLLDGKISSLTGTSTYTLTLLKPDGTIISTPLQINNGLFSWSWTIPSTATAGSSQIIGTDRKSVVSVNPSENLYGIYRITISSEYARGEFFFQVSKSPQNATEISPIAIETDNTEYVTTDVIKVSGQVVPEINAAAKEANAMVRIIVFSDKGQQAYRADANVNAGGQFHISIPLQPGVWRSGTYKLYAQYLTANTRTDFKVADPFTTSSGKLQVFMTTDHDKYLPGQTVLITGRTSYIISINTVDIAIGKSDDVIISEGQIMSKKGNVLPHATASFDQTGSFSYDYTIPTTASIGNYTVVAQVPFGAYEAHFEIVSQLPAENVLPQENATQSTNETQNAQPLTTLPDSIGPVQKPMSPNMITEKTGRISTPLIPITLAAKSIGNKTYFPIELDGLLRANPGDENNVNLKVTLENGACIVGQDSNCMVSASTIKGNVLYEVVKIGNQNFFIGYSGAGARLEQFSIIPTNANDVIPDGQWNVEIIKKDQTSRFYYQVAYAAK
ncbi:MAG: hypothetical protein AUI61_03845 [Thaumarchaeota archaeon 13_1_40CM_2_39_13_2]|nr:MAG: hypothetical protein AUI61_03845 [Thaumarchaeota archaeon 13_1_40CM_2_39_13_2]